MASRTNQVRIIGGRHRGRRLHFDAVRGLRPTPDRVRETLFNWLRADIPGASCLDLFAGSGAIGFEALSRGAACVTLVERDRTVARRLRDNAAMLGEGGAADVVHGDALRWLAAGAPARPYDVVFVDPPFAGGLLPGVCTRLESGPWLADGAVVYVEQDAHHPWPEFPANWSPVREGRAGRSSQRLLRRNRLR